MNTDYYTLMLVTHRSHKLWLDYLDFIKSCIGSGISAVQLREKNQPLAELLEPARALKKILDPWNIPLIVNDSIELALEVGANGVHLGQSDLSPAHARALLGPNAVIGLSIESEEELAQANTQDLNYVAASAVFPSQNKDNIKTFWGIDGLKRLAKYSKHPLIGIGGIDRSNLKSVMQTGVQGIAVIGALHDAKNPYETAMQMHTIIKDKSCYTD